jgi:hypothetical protein
MKKVLLAAIFALTTQAFAIIGVGAHYVQNTGTLKGDKETVDVFGQQADLIRSEVSGLQGLGFKLWIDLLPIVDIEGTFNVAAVRYAPYLQIGTEKKDLEYAPPAPYNMVFGKASPIYGVVSGDVSVTYPITFLPIIRPYAGLGVSYIVSTPLLNKKFVEGVLNDVKDPTNYDISEGLSDALKNAEYKSGIGGHLIVGSRFKLPIIPIAAYANVKYYFGGDIDDKFSQGVVFELGGGLAI